jgi:hypothetical protein
MATRRTISKAFGGSRLTPDVSVALVGVILVLGVLSIAEHLTRERGTRVFRVPDGAELRRGPADGCARADASALRGWNDEN